MKNISRNHAYLKATVAVAVVLTLLFSSATAIANVKNLNQTLSDTIYVDDVPGEGPGNPPEDFTVIQDAIDAANPGDTIFIYNGVYDLIHPTNVIVDKQLQITGESKEGTIVEMNFGWDAQDPLVQIQSDGVIIEGLSIFSSDTGGAVLYNNVVIEGASNCEIRDCLIGADPADTQAYSWYGIIIDGSSSEAENTKVINCEIVSGPSYKDSGILCKGTNATEIINCTIENYQKGVNIAEATDTVIAFSHIHNIMGCGIYSSSPLSGSTLIYECTIHDVTYGASLRGQASDLINSNIYNYSYAGVIINPSRCRIINNIFEGNQPNSRAISFALGTSQNQIHHNAFINNSNQVEFLPDYMGSNSFDDGYEGNYWDDFESNPGFPDVYEVGFNHVDNHPLNVWKRAPPQVAVLNPTGDEEEPFGREIPIEYNVADIIGNPVPDAEITVEYSMNGGDWTEIESGLANTGDYTWIVEDNSIEDNSRYLVRVAAEFNGDTGYGVSNDKFPIDATPPTVMTSRPVIGDIFIGDVQFLNLPLPFALAIGSLTIIADADDEMSGVEHVLFELGDFSFDDFDAPYSWAFNERLVGKRTLTITAFDNVGRSAQTEMDIFVINPLGG